MPSAAYARMNRRLSSAARQVTTKTLVTMNPRLKGEELAKAVARESLRDSQYFDNMRTRIASGITQIDQDPTLNPAGRRERYEALEGLERRYLRQHVDAATWRMRRDQEASILKQRGEPGAVWVLGNTTNHTADCLAMANRYWSWDVLDTIRPSTRHNGCDCRLIARGEADRRGIDWILGYRTPAMRTKTGLTEALLSEAKGSVSRIVGGLIYVPLRPGMGGNDLRFAGGPKGGQFAPKTHVAVPGNLAPPVRNPVEKMLDAAQQGDLDTADEQFAVARTAARKIKDPTTKRETLRTLTRVRAAVVNPSGRRTPMGARPEIAGAERPVPIGVPEADDDIVEPWTTDGRFGWYIPQTTLGKEKASFSQKLRRAGFTVRSVKGGIVLNTPANATQVDALSKARGLEAVSPELRFNRIVEEGEALGDPTPLGLLAEEINFKRSGHASRYMELPADGLGAAGETLITDVMDRMRALGLSGPDDEAQIHGLEGKGQGTKEAPVDWQLGDKGVEVKTEAFRGMDALIARAGQAKVKDNQRARKIAFAKANHLTPAYATIYADLDNDVGHVFMREYGPKDAVYGPQRVPQEMRDRLLSGELKPGEAATPAGDRERSGNDAYRTVFIGSFRLRYNPLRDTRISKDETVPAGTEPDAGQMQRIVSMDRGGRGAADIGVTKRVDEPQGPVDVAPEPDRDEQIISMASPPRSLSQARIARELGIGQSTVHGVLKKKAPQLLPGQKGARTDLKRTKRGKKRP